MGRFFVGSRSGEDARYRQKEADLAMTLKAPPEFDTITVPDLADIPVDWLQTRINSLFLQHLHFEDDITAGMVAESVRRLEDPRSILVTVTALSHEQSAAYKVMQQLWQSLPTAPRTTSSSAMAKAEDEITALRRRLENDLERKRTTTTRTTRTTVTRPAARKSRSRSPKRHNPTHRQQQQQQPTDQPTPANPVTSSTTWEQKMREKAWEAATASRRR